MNDLEVYRPNTSTYTPNDGRCELCGSSGWVLSEIKDTTNRVRFDPDVTYTVAKPCPRCQPNWVHPDKRPLPDTPEGKKQQRARERRALEDDREGWWKD